MRASHLTSQTYSGQAQTHITNRKSKHARSKKPYVPALFLLGDIFAMRIRYNLVMLGCDISRYARCDMIQIPSRPAGHIACRRQISLPLGNIANPTRDLYRCVFSVKDNTLTERGLVFMYPKNSETGTQSINSLILLSNFNFLFFLLLSNYPQSSYLSSPKTIMQSILFSIHF